MTTNIFNSAFFGWKDLPNLIEYQGKKLIPLKALKLKNGGNATYQSGLFDVSSMRRICEMVGITLYRPVLGLYCISDNECNFFSYLHQFLGKDYWWMMNRDDLCIHYQNFRTQILF